MIQSLPNTHSFTLNSLAQTTTAVPALQNSFSNQLHPASAIPAVGIASNTAFATQNFMIAMTAAVPFSQQQTSQNFLFNNAENQQNLMCFNAANYMSGYPTMGTINGQQNNLNQYQTSTNYLGQNMNLAGNETQQSMFQLKMMNMKYKQIIQQQQQQLKQMQMQQQLQQAAQTQQQQLQQQQQFNQIYPQQMINPFHSSANSINQMTFVNTPSATTTDIKNTCQNTPFSNNIVSNTICYDFKDGMYSDMNKIKLETLSQCQQNSLQAQSLEKSQQILQNCSSPLSIPSQAQAPLVQQLQSLNSQSELLTSMLANVSQNSNINNDFITQSNKLNTSQSSFNTVKMESTQNNKNQQFHQDLRQNMPSTTLSKRQASFSTTNSKSEDIQSSFEGIENNNSNKAESEQNNQEEKSKNINENNSKHGGSEKKQKCFAGIRSQQNNLEIDTQSHSQCDKISNQIDDVICKKRFTQVKQEDEQSNQVKSDVKVTNIAQSQQQQQESKKRFSNSILSSSASVFCEKNSMVSNSECNNIVKEDPQYLEFARMSSFDNIQEAQKSFDNLLKKLSVNQMVECVLSSLPAKPEETTNFENKFVNSMKAKQSKDKRNPNALYMTRFHNLTRLLMYNIVQLFSFDILSQNLNIHFYIAQELENICRKIKQHARQTCNGQFKTDFYTHSHYNGLFLVLEKNTISHIKKSQKDIEIHQQVYGVDLQSVGSISDENENLEVKKCNFFKILAHEILMRCSYQSIENSLINGDDARRIYFRRALSGITKLNKGQVVHRF